MIKQIKCDERTEYHTDIFSKYYNFSLFMVLGKRTMKYGYGLNKVIISLPELYTNRNSVLIENLIIMSIRKQK